jgi:hypothetical protein
MATHHDQGNLLKQGRRSWKRTPMFFMDNKGYKRFSYQYKIQRAGKQGIDHFHQKKHTIDLSIHKTTYLKVQKKTKSE